LGHSGIWGLDTLLHEIQDHKRELEKRKREKTFLSLSPGGHPNKGHRRLSAEGL
jgi:hypothetical protein